MQIELILADPKTQQLQFSIQKTPDADDQADLEYKLQKELLPYVILRNAPMTLQIKSPIYSISNCDPEQLNLLLSGMNQLFERYHVTGNQAFLAAVIKQFNIKDEALSLSLNQLVPDVLNHIGSFLNLNDRTALLESTRHTRQAMSDRRLLWQTHFPHRLNQLADAEADAAGKNPFEADTIFQKAFDQVYNDEYRCLNSHERKWMTRFKIGDRSILQELDLKNPEALQSSVLFCSDVKKMTAVEWAYKNGHQSLLDEMYATATRHPAIMKTFDLINFNFPVLPGPLDVEPEVVLATYFQKTQIILLCYAIVFRQPIEMIQSSLSFIRSMDGFDNANLNSVISIAERVGNEEAIAMLLAEGCVAHFPDLKRENLPPIIHAMRRDNLNIIRLLAKQKPLPDELLHELITSHDRKNTLLIEKFKILVEEGADINEKNTFLRSLLHCVAQNITQSNQCDIFKYLCSQPSIQLNTIDFTRQSVLYKLLEHAGHCIFLDREPTKTILLYCAQPQLVFGYLFGQPLFHAKTPSLTHTVGYRTYGGFGYSIKSAKQHPQVVLEHFLTEKVLEQLDKLEHRASLPVLLPLVGYVRQKCVPQKRGLFQQKMHFGVIMITNMLLAEQNSPNLRQLMLGTLKTISVMKKADQSLVSFGVFLSQLLKGFGQDHVPSQDAVAACKS
jgi:ankyrin repeat protein